MSTYNQDYKAFQEHVLCAAWMQAEMLRRAEAGAALARAIAPVDTDPRSKHPGRFQASISAEVVVRKDRKGGGSRACGRVTSDDPAAMHIEFGTKNTPAHRTLGGALDVMGAA